MNRQSRNAPSGPERKYWLRRGRSWVYSLLLIPLIYYGLYFLLHKPLPANPQLIAHRGDSKHAPENTLAAFQKATAVGADWLEFDLQMTKDGALVVIHDETVERTTNGSGAVKDLTLAEIRSLDAGNGERVPTFEEVLTLAKQAEIGIMPELKSPHLYPGLETKVVEAVTGANYTQQTIIQSFDPLVLEAVNALDPNLKVCRLYGPAEFNLAGPQPGQSTLVCPMAEMVVLYPWMLRQAHARQQRAFVWFGLIEHPWVMRLILALGADGLMVDDSPALAKILRR